MRPGLSTEAWTAVQVGSDCSLMGRIKPWQQPEITPYSPVKSSSAIRTVFKRAPERNLDHDGMPGATAIVEADAHRVFTLRCETSGLALFVHLTVFVR